jgi:hypothetical protein
MENIYSCEDLQIIHKIEYVSKMTIGQVHIKKIMLEFFSFWLPIHSHGTYRSFCK